MARLVDTTIRLLSQEPLAGRLGTARLLRVAEALDCAGFEYLEVMGSRCFDWAVRGGVESPWERIRALRSRCRETPLAMALRGRLLVGSHPVSPDLVRRFVASAAEGGIDVFRVYDPLNDLTNLEEAAAAIRAADKKLLIGLVHNHGPSGENGGLVRIAKQIPELGATGVILNDPAGSIGAAHAAEIVSQVGEASGLPVGLYTQGAAGRALSAAIEAARGGASPLACAIYPIAISVHRPAGEALAQSLAGIGHDSGVSVPTLWEACRLVDDALGDEPVLPLTPRVAVRAAEHDLPAGLVAGIDSTLRSQGLGDRLDEVLNELTEVRRECGFPPLVSPIGHVLGSQALLNVLSAERWGVVVDEARDLITGRYGATPQPVEAAVKRAAELVESEDEAPLVDVDLAELRESADGLASSEEDLLLIALYGDDARTLLQSIRGRTRREERDSDPRRSQVDAERIRDLIAVVRESGIGEVTIEEGGTRVTVRSGDSPEVAPGPELTFPGRAAPEPEASPLPSPPDIVRVESPMVGTFYRAPGPELDPFVEEGDPVAPGQTLCILEAMKLMNEVKADMEGIVRRICVANAEPVEYGQLLFELEPLNGRPLDAL